MRYENILNYAKTPEGLWYPRYSSFVDSRDSPRSPGGQLRLEPQRYDRDLRETRRLKHTPSSTGMASYPPSGVLFGMNPYSVYDEELLVKATERFYTRLHSGRAALGMSLVSAGQSRDMIAKRLSQLTSVFEGADARNVRRKKRYRPSDGAGDVLEYNFGWLSLLEDVIALTGSMWSMGVPPLKITGRASGGRTLVREQFGFPTIRTTMYTRERATVDAFVALSNPNYWLVNRAGVDNPLALAWDAIPWSWLVNVFSNMNAYLTQTSNLFGVTVYRISSTQTSDMSADIVRSNYEPFGAYDEQIFCRFKQRRVGSIPPIELRFKIPEFDFSLCAILGSALVQKLRGFKSVSPYV